LVAVFIMSQADSLMSNILKAERLLRQPRRRESNVA
jgi:hypothetical protein